MAKRNDGGFVLTMNIEHALGCGSVIKVVKKDMEGHSSPGLPEHQPGDCGATSQNNMEIPFAYLKSHGREIEKPSPFVGSFPRCP